MAEIGAFYLSPAEIFVGKTKTPAVTTVLGSCVAVTLFVPVKFWAICHAVLPSRGYSVEVDARRGAFVEDAILKMIEEADRKGVLRSNIVAKIFGGASIGETLLESVGELNVQVAEEILEKANIPIVAGDVGGARGRKIIFVTATGDVLVKQLELSQARLRDLES